VLLVDDLFATGATMRACADLVTKAGGVVAAGAVVVEVVSLGGRESLEGYDLVSLCELSVDLDG
jgi:adenine phosphoribosyltransferase